MVRMFRFLVGLRFLMSSRGFLLRMIIFGRLHGPSKNVAIKVMVVRTKQFFLDMVLEVKVRIVWIKSSRVVVSIVFMFTPIWGRFPFWRADFSKGLVQPPTSKPLTSFQTFISSQARDEIFLSVTFTLKTCLFSKRPQKKKRSSEPNQHPKINPPRKYQPTGLPTTFGWRSMFYWFFHIFFWGKITNETFTLLAEVHNLCWIVIAHRRGVRFLRFFCAKAFSPVGMWSTLRVEIPIWL